MTKTQVVEKILTFMQISRLKTKNYSIIIGKNSLLTLNSEIRDLCPKCKKIAVIIDKKIPKKFLKI